MNVRARRKFSFSLSFLQRLSSHSSSWMIRPRFSSWMHWENHERVTVMTIYILRTFLSLLSRSLLLFPRICSRILKITMARGLNQVSRTVIQLLAPTQRMFSLGSFCYLNSHLLELFGYKPTVHLLFYCKNSRKLYVRSLFCFKLLLQCNFYLATFYLTTWIFSFTVTCVLTYVDIMIAQLPTSAVLWNSK